MPVPLLFFSPAASATSTAIELVAEKTLVRADGRSTTVITARIFDDRGAPIPDGTRVQFVTTLGRLDATVVESRGGVARVTLTAADQPGVATLTANLEATPGSIPSRLQISFTNDAQLTESTDRWMRISGAGYIGYAFAIPSNTGRYIYAEDKGGKASLTYHGITVRAQRFILDTGKRFLKADGDVVVVEGKKELRYRRFRIDFTSGIGAGERTVEFKTVQYRIQVPGLQEALLPPVDNQPQLPRDSWAFPDISEAQITVVASAIALDLDSTLQFRNATFYVQGQKAFSTKLHIMTPQQTSLYRDQLVGFGSNGLWLNLPYYYSVNPGGVGTLYLRRGGQFGSSVYSQRQGWTLDLNQTYNAKNGMEGLFQVLNLARGDRGYRLQHNQSFDKNTNGSLFADLNGGKDLFASTQFGHSFPQFRLGVNAAGSRYHGLRDTQSGTSIPASGDWRVQTLAETFPRLLTPRSGIRYTLTGAHTDQHFFGQATTLARGPVHTDNLGTRFYANPIRLDRQTTLTQSGVVGYTWVKAPATTSGIGASGASLQATTAFSRPVQWRKTSLGSIQLTYDYFQTPPLFVPTTQATGSGQTITTVQQGRHRLGVTTYLSTDSRWSFSLSGSRGIDTTQSNLYSEARFALGGPWLGRVRVTQSQAAGFGYRDLEYALIRTINNREIALYYSTIAKRFQLDLSGLSF